MHFMRFRQAIALLASILTAACGVGGPAVETAGQPSPTFASVEPTPSPAWVTFSSDRHAYAIDHPADWRVLEQVGTPNLPGMRVRPAGTDTIASPTAARFDGDDGVVVVSSHELEPGESLEDFSTRVSHTAACRTDGYGHADTRLDGEPAESRKFSCSEWDWIQITAIHAGRGYVVWLVATMPPKPADRPINDQFLASFRFTE